MRGIKRVKKVDDLLLSQFGQPISGHFRIADHPEGGQTIGTKRSLPDLAGQPPVRRRLQAEASFAFIGEQLAGGSTLLSPAQYTGTWLLYIVGQRMLRSLSVYCSGF